MTDKKTIRVLQVLPALNTGGVEKGTLEVARAIVEKGWQSIVVSNGGRLVPRLEGAGTRHIKMPIHSKNPLVMFLNYFRLKSIIRDYDIDVVHARSRAPGWPAYFAAKHRKVPFITTFHGTYNYRSKLKKFYNSVMVRGVKVIAISEFISDFIRKHYKLDKRKVIVVPRGVDPVVFDPENVSQQRMIKLAHDWRLEDGAFVVMLPGRLTTWKGQQILIKALAQLRDLDIMVVLVGPAKSELYRRKLEVLVKGLDLAGRVRLVDDCDDMPAALMLSDVVVSASTDPEAFGRVVVEAQAMCKPVVASNHGGASETIVHGKTGWLTQPGHVKELADTIREVYNLSLPERKKVGQQGRKSVLKSYTTEMMCSNVLNVYEKAIKNV